MREVWTDLGEDQLTDVVMMIGYDGEFRPRIGTVADLADDLRHRAYAAVEVEVRQLLADDGHGNLASASYTVGGGTQFDDNDWALARVRVTFSDGHLESAYYTIDGRA